MDGWTQTLSAGWLLGIAAMAIVLILLLIVKLRVHALLTLVSVSLLTAVATGLPMDKIVNDVLLKNFGGTLGSVALLVGLGAMLGRLVETSGGAQSLADALIRMFGEKRAPFALGVASLIFGFPIFFDAGLVVMLPIVFATARRMKQDVLPYALASIGAFSVMHVFLPPHPGPIAASEFYSANIGQVLILGLPVAMFTWYVSGYLLGKVLGRTIRVPVPDLLSGGAVDNDRPQTPAKASTVVGIMLIPMLLIFMNTGLSTLISEKVVSADEHWVQVARMIGSTPVALLISVLVALYVLGRKRGEKASALEKTVDGALAPACSAILITGPGGIVGGAGRFSLRSLPFPVPARHRQPCQGVAGRYGPAAPSGAGRRVAGLRHRLPERSELCAGSGGRPAGGAHRLPRGTFQIPVVMFGNYQYCHGSLLVPLRLAVR